MSYYDILTEAKDKINTYISVIFQVYEDELILKLEDYNLLSDPNNCIESSTATGYIIEEFITSKLVKFTKKYKDNPKQIHITRINKSTNQSCGDIYANYKDVYFIINIKCQKEGSQNNQVASINSLVNDYCDNVEKSLMIVKIKYEFINSTIDLQRKIKINDIEEYCIEEIDFSEGHKQDNRTWSTASTGNSGILQIPENWKKKHLKDPSDISFESTYNDINNMNDFDNSTNNWKNPKI